MVTNTEIQHWSHPHKLIQETMMTNYTCDGCKEPGTGPKYRCAACDYDLHKECALALPSARHPLFTDSAFQLLLQPPPPGNNRLCDGCGKRVRGFMYHCPRTDFDLHPCCLTVPGPHINETRERTSADVLSRSINTPSYDVDAIFTASYNQRLADIVSELNALPAQNPNSVYGATYNQVMANMISGISGLRTNSNMLSNPSYVPLAGLAGGSYGMLNHPYMPPQVPNPFEGATSSMASILPSQYSPLLNASSGQGMESIISALAGDPTGGIMSLITSFAQL